MMLYICEYNYELYVCMSGLSIYRAKITSFEGRLEVKMAPKVVSQRDEADLQAMIKRIEEENEEVDGDAPEDA